MYSTEPEPGLPGMLTYMMHEAVNRMTFDDRARFLALRNCKSGPDLVSGILDTNAFPIGPLPAYNVPHTAICATASRINHR